MADQIFLLIGSDIPFILRPKGEKFEFFGPCCVHEIMYEEGFHHRSYINPHFYPSSIPEGEWDFSDTKVPSAKWVAAVGDCPHNHYVVASASENLGSSRTRKISALGRGSRSNFNYNEKNCGQINVGRITCAIRYLSCIGRDINWLGCSKICARCLLEAYRERSTRSETLYD